MNNGTTATQYFAKQTVSKTSVETDSSSTFQIYVPRAQQITVRYALLRRAGRVRHRHWSSWQHALPSTGDLELDARHTGGLKVTLVPLQANNKLPDTADATLTSYRQQMLAMYPIDSITFSVATPLTIAYPVGLGSGARSSARQTKSRRSRRRCLLLRMLKPQDTFRAFCGQGCTAGIGFVADLNTPGYRVAMGVAYADSVSGETMAHEIGHNHGRNHAPCVPPGQLDRRRRPQLPIQRWPHRHHRLRFAQ